MTTLESILGMAVLVLLATTIFMIRDYHAQRARWKKIDEIQTAIIANRDKSITILEDMVEKQETMLAIKDEIIANNEMIVNTQEDIIAGFQCLEKLDKP